MVLLFSFLFPSLPLFLSVYFSLFAFSLLEYNCIPLFPGIIVSPIASKGDTFDLTRTNSSLSHDDRILSDTSGADQSRFDPSRLSLRLLFEARDKSLILGAIIPIDVFLSFDAKCPSRAINLELNSSHPVSRRRSLRSLTSS